MGCAVTFGLVLIFFGVLLLLENLGISDDLLNTYWPVILIVLGLVTLFNLYRIRSRFRRSRYRGPPPPQ